MKIKTRLLSIAATASLSFSSTALAASGTASFDVSVQVLASCSISASNMSFASITTGTTTNTDATSTLTVNCSSGTPFTIALGNGANFTTERRMAWGGSYITYSLFQDSSRSLEWVGANTKSGTGTGADQSFTVYGRIPSGQNISNTGSYGDTIIATISY